MTPQEPDAAHGVVVLGGGLAGLAAATAAADAGLAVTLVEGRGGLGGRAQSFTDDETGDELDTGQHVLLGCYAEMLAYLERIGAQALVRFQSTLTVELISPSGGRARLACPALPAPLHLAAGLLGHRLLSLNEKLGCLHVVQDARLRHDDPALDRMSVSEWLDARGQSENVQRALWTPLCLATLNASPADAAASLLAIVIAKGLLGPGQSSALGLSTVGLSTLHAEPARRHLAERGGVVMLNQPASEILLDDEGVAGLRLREGRLLPARQLISAVDAQTLLGLLPAEWKTRPPFAGLARFRPSPIVSLHLWLDRPILDVPFVGLLDTELQWVFDRERTWGTPARGGHLVSLVVSGADAFAALDKHEVYRRCWRDLLAAVPRAREATVLRWLVVKERAATFRPSPGLAAARFGPTTPITGLLVAGDWTDTGLPATMEGACASGHAAVRQLRASPASPDNA